MDRAAPPFHPWLNPPGQPPGTPGSPAFCFGRPARATAGRAPLFPRPRPVVQAPGRRLPSWRTPAGPPLDAHPARFPPPPPRRVRTRQHPAATASPRFPRGGWTGWLRDGDGLHGGARGSCATQRSGCLQTGQVGAGAGADPTRAGAFQSSSAAIRSRFARAAAPSRKGVSSWY